MAIPKDRTGKRPLICLDPNEFQGDETWHLDDILREFIEGFRFLLPLKKEVTFFGSARLSRESKWYQEAERLGTMLAERGYTVITGGGPGIMEAANKGAHHVGLASHQERSIGIDIILGENGDSNGNPDVPPNVEGTINVNLPEAERRNSYVDRRMAFHYFFTRKVMLSASAQAYVFFPGGFGTLDEFSEILTLVQTQKMEKVPIACVGKEYWEPLAGWMKSMMLDREEKLIGPNDMDLFKIVDTAEEALPIIETSKERKFF